MANSISTDLTIDSISQRTLTYLGNRFAPFNAFATDFSNEQYQQGQNVRVQIANAGATVQTNPTNWESGDSGLANVNILVNQYSVSFHLTPRQLNNKFTLDQMVNKNLQNLGDKIIDVAFAPFTSVGSTNFANITVAQGSIAAANLKTAMVAIAKSDRKNLILDATSYYQLAPNDKNGFELRDGAYGFDGLYLNTRWNGAGSNVYGFAGGPGAVALITGLPERVGIEGEFTGLEQTVLNIPLGGGGTINQGLTPPSVQLLRSTWLSLATRTRWLSFELMLGASATGDSNSGIVFKSA